ncbi:MAG: YeeE/YedE family protein, partial [Pseudomonadales bacterium]|nr:YeeE/YedE family protein [Pseudomonadales bacterium]
SLPLIITGGLVVGFGVKLGHGCTSGHGICGIGRLSTRSIVATATFMIFAILTVFVRLHLL